MKETIRKCPVCDCMFEKQEHRYVCATGHSFDVSKEGYVNLLTGNSKKYGDDQMMVQARRDFLASDLYLPLVEKIHELIGNNEGVILDIGCGEGWYLRSLQSLRKQTDDAYFGIDLSKEAVKSCSKQTQGQFAVGNAYSLPVRDASCDILLSIFSPYDETEIVRCLKESGFAIIVGPGSNHLYEFIEMIWDTPHKHILKNGEDKYSSLQLLDSHNLQIPMLLENNDGIQNLFKMTPYYRKAPKQKQESILNLQRLETTADFVIDVVSC